MSKRTEKQNRRWLHTKLSNILWKIITPNAYGVLRSQQALVRDLRAIIDDFERQI